MRIEPDYCWKCGQTMAIHDQDVCDATVKVFGLPAQGPYNVDSKTAS